MNDEATPAAATEDALTDLIERVRRTRRIANPWGDDASRGIRTSELNALLDHWVDGYDWPTHENRVRALPWVVTGKDRGRLRSIHQRSSDPEATTVVLLHGWPDSVLRFERLLPLLVDFNLVVPALPGFPFSLPMDEPMSAQQIADVVADSMAELGYERYVVSGGDIGGTLGELLAVSHPDRVSALHLANVAAAHVATADPGRLPVDAVEYLLDWPDTNGAFSRDELLTWVSAYWFTATIGTSFSTYVEPSRLPDRVETATVISDFPGDIIAAPRSYAEHFVNVQRFITHESGGHFAAWERPDDYAADLRCAAELSLTGAPRHG